MRALFVKTARIAARQHGRIAWEQLIAAGVDRRQIQRWVADGRLLPVHHGVYAVGHEAPSLLGDYMAAVLACGAGAVLSKHAQAHILRLLPGKAPPPEVTVPSLSGRSRPGIVIHRVKVLHPRDVCVVNGIPGTTVPRTLLDLAPALDLTELARACHEAWVQHRTTPRFVEACMERNPGKKGRAKLRAALGADATLSALEDGFLALVRRHGLPAPRTNVVCHGDKVDCHWPQLGLTVELVSYRFHGSRRAFEGDIARRRRSNHLAFSWGDVFERGDRTVAELVAAMNARRPGLATRLASAP
jgi:Transcriptional regulator, AbiEi antitoxin